MTPANLDYAHNLSPEVEAYLEPFSKEGWPQGGPNPENPRDRARQENALLANAEKGEALISIHTQYVAAKAAENDRCDRKGVSLAHA